MSRNWKPLHPGTQEQLKVEIKIWFHAEIAEYAEKFKGIYNGLVDQSHPG
jgi:hypothetical protein